MTNSADPDQLASSNLDPHCLQRQDIPGLAGQGLIYFWFGSLFLGLDDFILCFASTLAIYHFVTYYTIQ